MKYAIYPVLLTLLSVYTSAQTKTETDHTQALLQLARDNNEEKIEAYFSENGYSANGVDGRPYDTCIQLTEIICKKMFIRAIEKNNFNVTQNGDRIGYCQPDDLNCLLKISVDNGSLCPTTNIKSTDCAITENHIDYKNVFEVKNADSLLSNAWVSNSSRIFFISSVKAALAKQGDAKDLQKQNEQKESRTKQAQDSFNKKINEEGCIELDGKLVQKISESEYEVIQTIGSLCLDGTHVLNCPKKKILYDNEHIILKTKSLVFESTGKLPSGVYVKFSKEDKRQLLNGFSKKVRIFSENKTCISVYKNYLENK